MVTFRSLTPASARRRFASSREAVMSCEKPGIFTSSASGVAMFEPGRMTPPTYLRKVELCSFAAAPQRSMASESARRTRASSNGGRLVLKTTRRLESQGLSLMSMRSPSVSTRSSRCGGVTPRNSAAMRPLL